MRKPAPRRVPALAALRPDQRRAVTGGAKPIKDGAITDEEYADWGVSPKP